MGRAGPRRYSRTPLPTGTFRGNNRRLVGVNGVMAMGIERLFGRDPALRREIEGSRDMLCRMAYAWCHDRALADDLAQAAVEKGLRASAQLRDPARLRAWLLQILANCLRDHLREARDFVDIEVIEESMAADGATPEESRVDAELVARVRLAVAGLPLAQRQVVTLVDLEELSYTEAAEALGIPIGTVMSRLCRARRALREVLEPVAKDALGLRLRSVK